MAYISHIFTKIDSHININNNVENKTIINEGWGETKRNMEKDFKWQCEKERKVEKDLANLLCPCHHRVVKDLRSRPSSSNWTAVAEKKVTVRVMVRTRVKCRSEWEWEAGKHIINRISRTSFFFSKIDINVSSLTSNFGETDVNNHHINIGFPKNWC